MASKRVRAIEVIPFKINNLEPFLGDSEYPDYNPLTQKYADYWDERTSECVYGLWGDDSKTLKNGNRIGGYRWLPGNMVFATQHCVIERELPGRTTKGLARPDLRDIEWFVGYDLATCDGFSGFSEDRKFTSFRPVGKLQRGEQLTNSEKLLIDQYGDLIRDRNGKLKQYVESREYLYMTHDKPLGEPMWFNESMNYMLLSTRRLGKSYIIINGVCVYDMCFNGAKTLDDLWEQRTKTNNIVGSGVSDKTKEFFNKWTTTYNYLRTDVGSYFSDGIDETGAFWWKLRGSVDKENDFLTNSVKVEGGDGYTGPGSVLWNVTYGKSKSKGAGLSQTNAIIEECGLTDGLEDIHAENSPAQRGDYKFGKSIYIGTGGDFELIESSKKMFYKPNAYDIMPCKNLFTIGGEDTARFIPATYYLNQFRDEDGNQDVKAAFEDIMTERESKKKEDARQYIRHKASYPLDPSEIFLKIEGNDFPVVNLERRESELMNGAISYSVGDITYSNYNNTEAYWMEDLNAIPIMHINDIEDEKIPKKGAIVQYEPPIIQRKPRIPNDENPLYQLYLEPVRNEIGSSLVYAYVWKGYDFANPEKIQNNIVCEWFGRLDSNDANHDRIMKMATYYGCNIFMEANNDALLGYARRKGRLDWLVDNLGHMEGLGVKSTSNNEKGFYVAPGMKPSLEKLTKEFLEREVDKREIIDANGYRKEIIILADVLNSRLLVSQLINYNSEGNFDAVDGLRLKAVFDRGTEEIDPQFANMRGEDKLKEMIKRVHRMAYSGIALQHN